ncbi:WXG100 family type VII secretion target [Catenulispora pinisilvae]|uniref:WXG100 family type VII secretion target n=1 Tax=Catenulispora pinisilvae TaxID=2705253 RepID=UPI001890CEF1|nr:hypothetical protein [Catenulispora pinisilvae]
MTIQADPDDFEKHGREFQGHVQDMDSIHSEMYSLLDGDIGLRGDDEFSRAFQENHVARVRDLADSVRGASDGVSGISQGMQKMAADYRATDAAATEGVSSLTSPDAAAPHSKL